MSMRIRQQCAEYTPPLRIEVYESISSISPTCLQDNAGRLKVPYRDAQTLQTFTLNGRRNAAFRRR